MGKLIGQLFKEDFKDILPWLVFPPIVVIATLMVLVTVGENAIIGMIAGMSMMLVFMFPFVALIQAAVNDWTRFYGKNAAFYSALPYDSGTVIGARLINYILMGILACLAALINITILFASQAGDLSFLEAIGEGFELFVANYGAYMTFLTFIYVLVYGVTVVSEILFANSIGASKAMSKLGSFAPVLVFFIVNFLVTILFVRLQIQVLGDYMFTSNLNPDLIEINLAVNPPYGALGWPIAINLLIIAILNGLAYYFHNKKLSVV